MGHLGAVKMDPKNPELSGVVNLEAMSQTISLKATSNHISYLSQTPYTAGFRGIRRAPREGGGAALEWV